MHFLYLHYSGCVCSNCTEDSGSSTLVVFENFLVFQFPFSQFQTKISSFFCQKLVISLIIPDVFLHFQCLNSQLVRMSSSKYLKLTEMVYYNHSSLVILVSSVFNFYPSFQLPQALSHCISKPFIKSIEFYLLRYKCWLNYFLATK